MSNYEQMELNITLDGERELKENVMLSVEFAYDQLKSCDLPNVANRYEGYGIAANMWSQLAAKEKGVKDSMKHFLVTLDIGEQAAIGSSLFSVQFSHRDRLYCNKHGSTRQQGYERSFQSLF